MRLYHLLYGLCLRHIHQGALGARVALHRLRLGDQEHRVAHVFGRELPPMLMELDALAQPDRPAFAIGHHLPLLGQLGNVCPGVPANADEELQGEPFI